MEHTLRKLLKVSQQESLTFQGRTAALRLAQKIPQGKGTLLVLQSYRPRVSASRHQTKLVKASNQRMKATLPPIKKFKKPERHRAKSISLQAPFS
jgi:hypothetical protein